MARLGRSLLGAYLWHDTQYPSPVPENPKFMTPRESVGLIRDGDVVAVSGLGGNQRAAIVFLAIRDTFAETGHPEGLTIVNLGGHGGRGRAPGTLETSRMIDEKKEYHQAAAPIRTTTPPAASRLPSFLRSIAPPTPQPADASPDSDRCALR